MTTSRRIYCAISAHGYGHLTQTIALVRALLDIQSETELYIQCALPKEVISDRLGTESFHHQQRSLDVGMIQLDPLTPDIEKSRAAYRALHNNYASRIKEEAEQLKQIAPDLLIADIPYLPIAAASEAGVPSVALASLTWDHIMQSYFGAEDVEVKRWCEQARSSYAKATLALLPTPAMDGQCFANRIEIPPIAALGEKQKCVRSRIGIDPSDTRPLILCSLGGITGAELPIAVMEAAEEYHWLINVPNLPEREHLHRLNGCCSYPYKEIIASVDGVVGKPGYGMAVEVVALDLPFVFVQRGHFPDEAIIIEWLLQNARAKEVTAEEWRAGRIVGPLQEMMNQNRKPAVECNGAEVGARHIDKLLQKI